MITSLELESFQSCRALWKFSKDDGSLIPPPDPYFEALKKTIFQLYSRLQEKNKFMNDKQLRERWERNWWQVQVAKRELDEQTILQKSTQGWLYLEKYWGDTYLEEYQYTPIGINITLTPSINNLIYSVPIHIVLADSKGKYIFKQMTEKESLHHIYTSLASKLEVIAVTEAVGAVPIRKEHISLGYAKPTIRQINISEEYAQTSYNILKEISTAIRYNTIYGSRSTLCVHCKYKEECWV